MHLTKSPKSKSEKVNLENDKSEKEHGEESNLKKNRMEKDKSKKVITQDLNTDSSERNITNTKNHKYNIF